MKHCFVWPYLFDKNRKIMNCDFYDGVLFSVRNLIYKLDFRLAKFANLRRVIRRTLKFQAIWMGIGPARRDRQRPYFYYDCKIVNN